MEGMIEEVIMKFTSGEDTACVLDKCIKQLQDDDFDVDDGLVKAISNEKLVNTLPNILRNSHSAAKAAQFIAELARLDECREVLVGTHSSPLITSLCTLFKSHDPQCTLQACRAVGNLCFEEDRTRSRVIESGCVPDLIGLINSFDKDSTLLRTAAGCLLNLIQNNDKALDVVVSSGGISSLHRLLQHSTEAADLALLRVCLMTLSNASATVSGQMSTAEEKLVLSVISLLNKPKVVEELIDDVFELLSDLLENDVNKTEVLQSEEVTREILAAVEYQQYRREEDTSALHRIADIIVLLLSADEGVEQWFSNENVLMMCKSWLKLESKHMICAGALAIGNLSRAESHSQSLISRGLVDDLLLVLPAFDSVSRDAGDDHITHAVLSALRNFSVPATSRGELADRVLPVVGAHVMSASPFVQFKALGCCRLLVQQQNPVYAEQLVKRDGFVSRVCELCKHEDHAGIRGESSRLLAMLSVRCAPLIVEEDVTSQLLEMTGSKHALMQHEALQGLTELARVQETVRVRLVQRECYEKILATLKSESDSVLIDSMQLLSQISSYGESAVDVIEAAWPVLIELLNKNSSDSSNKLGCVEAVLKTSLELSKNSIFRTSGLSSGLLGAVHRVGLRSASGCQSNEAGDCTSDDILTKHKHITELTAQIIDLYH